MTGPAAAVGGSLTALPLVVLSPQGSAEEAESVAPALRRCGGLSLILALVGVGRAAGVSRRTK